MPSSESAMKHFARGESVAMKSEIGTRSMSVRKRCDSILSCSVLRGFKLLFSVVDESHEKTFTWEKLNYNVPTPKGPLRLLHDVDGFVKRGSLTALMGASGAGKIRP